MKTEITIIAGHDNNEPREIRTLDWLRKHGASIEEWNGLQVITMQAEKPSKGQYNDQWTIGFDDAEGNPEQSYLLIDLEVNPFDTCIEVKYEGSYSCSCHGYGCTKCNDELASIEKGVNPWEHHTAK
jgi:hypothetical protein